MTRYEKTCHKSLFVEIALLVLTERSRFALFNGAKTRFVRSGAMDVYNADVRESRSLETGVYVQLIQLLPVTP